jgi:uracil-DNA glycosylase
MRVKPIFLLGEAMGEAEAKIGKGFVGASGIELLRMLSESGVITWTETDQSYLHKYYNTGDPHLINMIWNLHPEVYRSNVFQLHPPSNDLSHFCGPIEGRIPGYPQIPLKGNKKGWVRREFETQLDRLADEILAVDPNLIIALGNIPLWALCGRTGVSKIRGTTCLSTHCVSDYKILSTYHPSAILQGWENRPVTLIDLAKAPHESTFPEVRRPACSIWIEPSITDIEAFINEQIIGCKILAADIETSGTRVTCIGFAPRRDIAIVIPFDDERKPGRSYWPTQEDELAAWALVRRILEDGSIPKVLQNGCYDAAFLWRSYGIKTMNFKEDTMLLHHALLPESLKGLGFLGSVYTDFGPWKTERKGMDMTIKRDA